MVKAYCRSGPKGKPTKRGQCAVRTGEMGVKRSVNTGRRTGKSLVRAHSRKKK